MIPQRLISIISVFFVLPACASTSANNLTRLAGTRAQEQHFSGTVQRTSADGHTPYGPPFSSLVKRTMSADSAQVTECVLQEGKVFVTELTRTAEPLVYTVTDSAGSFTGRLIFEDKSLMAWSYDIRVLKPQPGQILGGLRDGNGARIDARTGQMTITKIWNGQVRLREDYKAISREEYNKAFDAVTHGTAPSEIIAICRE